MFINLWKSSTQLVGEWLLKKDSISCSPSTSIHFTYVGFSLLRKKGLWVLGFFFFLFSFFDLCVILQSLWFFYYIISFSFSGVKILGSVNDGGNHAFQSKGFSLPNCHVQTIYMSESKKLWPLESSSNKKAAQILKEVHCTATSGQSMDTGTPFLAWQFIADTFRKTEN